MRASSRLGQTVHMSTPRPNRPLRDDFDDVVERGPSRPFADQRPRHERETRPGFDTDTEPVPDDDITAEATHASTGVWGGVVDIASGVTKIGVAGANAVGDTAEEMVETAAEFGNAVVGKVGDFAEVLAGGSNPWADPESSSDDGGEEGEDANRGDIISELGDELD